MAQPPNPKPTLELPPTKGRHSRSASSGSNAKQSWWSRTKEKTGDALGKLSISASNKTRSRSTSPAPHSTTTGSGCNPTPIAALVTVLQGSQCASSLNFNTSSSTITAISATSLATSSSSLAATAPSISISASVPQSASASSNSTSTEVANTPISSNFGAPLNPVQALRVLPPDIFPDNGVARTKIDYSVPNIGDDFSDATQLSWCAHAISRRVPSPLSSTSSSSRPLNDKDQWIQHIEESPREKEHISLMMHRMVDKFIFGSTKDPDSIREIVLVGPWLDKARYLALLNRLFNNFRDNAFLDVNNLFGLVQLVQDAPPKALDLDGLTRILRSFRQRLEDSAAQDSENTFDLTLALTVLLTVLLGFPETNLRHEQEHAPLVDVLSDLRKSKSALVKYQAEYALQTLLTVPHDETTLHEFRRHAIGLTGGLLTISNIVRLEFDGLKEGLPDVIESGKGLYRLLKERLGSGPFEAWYLEAQKAEEFIRQGHFKNLNQLISEGPCATDPKFQWRVSQLLGEVAVDVTWNDLTRSRALTLLHEYIKVNSGLKQQPEIKRWVLTILGHIVERLADNALLGTNRIQTVRCESIMEQAQTLMLDICRSGETPFESTYPLRCRLALPRSSRLLKEVISSPDLEYVVHQLRRQRWERHSDKEVYIETMSKASLHASDDKLTPLKERTCAFLEGKGKVFLIVGDSGAGKSTFSRRLENDLWETYEEGGAIPLFIDLKTIDRDKDLIEQHLDDLRLFSKDHMDELRLNRDVVLICDGFDERRNMTNLYAKNRFHAPKQWKVKMLISCRTQYLKEDYRSLFEPQSDITYNQSRSGSSELFEEATIVPFKEEQIQDYIEQFTKHQSKWPETDEQQLWTAERYTKTMKTIPQLTNLVKNPFLLRLMLETLPRIIGSRQDLSTIQVSRVRLYDEFVFQRFMNEHLRLCRQRSNNRMSQAERDALDSVEDDFIHHCIDYSARLAAAMFTEQGGVNAVKFSLATDKQGWKAQFFGTEANAKLLRESSAIVKSRNSFKFEHRSIMEYFFTCLIFEPRRVSSDTDDSRKAHRHLHLADCLDTTEVPSPLARHPFGLLDIVHSEPSVIDFMTERVQQNLDFKNQLHAIINLSKLDASVSQAAANAITILVRAGVHFNGADLRYIRISGADLTEGQFDYTRFEGADLKGCNFTRTWLRHADFTSAQMENVWFGEKPYLRVPGLCSFAASPNGEMLAAGLEKGDITVYGSPDWRLLYTLRGHSERINSVTFSSDGERIASGSDDRNVRVWCLLTGNCIQTFKGHSHAVECVLFAPDGRRVAAQYNHNTVRIWDIRSGEYGPSVNVHTCHKVMLEEGTLILKENGGDSFRWDIVSGKMQHYIRGYFWSSMAWSPDGDYLAAGGSCNTVKLWNVATNEFKTLSQGHIADTVCKVFTYSPDGTRLVTEQDGRLCLWTLPTGNSKPVVINNYGRDTTAASFSRDGRWIAACGYDQSVRLWDVQSGSCVATMRGHQHLVCGVAFLNDRELASGGCDGMARFWQLRSETGSKWVEHGGTKNQRRDYDNAVYHPNGKWLTTITYNCGPIRQWDSETGVSQLVSIFSQGSTISYSSDGQKWAVAAPRMCTIYEASKDGWRSLEELEGSPVVYSPCGTRMAIGRNNGDIQLRDLRPNVGDHRLLKGPSSSARKLVFSRSGGLLASLGNYYTQIWIWDIDQTDCPRPLCGKYTGLSDIAFSPCGGIVAIAYNSGISLLNVRTEEEVALLNEGTFTGCVAWSNCGRWIIAKSGGQVVLWKIDTEGSGLKGCNTGAVVELHADSLQWSPSSLEFAILSFDSISVWKIVEDKEGIRLCLVWGSFVNRLMTEGTSIIGAIGLSGMHRTLLVQRSKEPPTILWPKFMRSQSYLQEL
ncbi:hypothetical protein EMPS_07281 [Entomortierella parvispora]|uniref:NACHT domain-containing protein n=1 Tax=Entomortierella parvispora TaxID=205924 RepID=A0A9P3HEA1_9FUNG|nr:hypothetical protein EMPS_07281 [Entomortierella parvispora]